MMRPALSVEWLDAGLTVEQALERVLVTPHGSVIARPSTPERVARQCHGHVRLGVEAIEWRVST